MSGSSATTIALTWKIFMSLGLLEVVSDNAGNFTSKELKEFLNENGVKHVSERVNA